MQFRCRIDHQRSLVEMWLLIRSCRVKDLEFECWPEMR